MEIQFFIICIEEEEEEEEEYFIDQLRTHKGHSNYNDWQYGIQTYNVYIQDLKAVIKFNSSFQSFMKTVSLARATKRIVGPQGKRKLVPPPPVLQIMILKLSPPRCVISKESVQQKWMGELWFRKQLSTCLFVWTLNYNGLVHLLDVFL